MQLHDILLLRTSAILPEALSTVPRIAAQLCCSRNPSPIVYLFVFALYIEYNALHIAKNAFNV